MRTALEAPNLRTPRSFDVLCAGEALWRLAEGEDALRLRPGGGAVKAAFALARQGLRVGLSTVLADDMAGRALIAKLAARGVDVGGVELAHPSSGLVLTEGRGGARQVVSFREEEQPIAIPAGWTSQVLLLSGMSPVVAHGAALCRAARAARRAGSVVVVDVNASWHMWKGRDPRNIRMVLREADVVWCSAEDLFGLNLDLPSLRAALRPDAVLVLSDAEGSARATGPFGEVVRGPREAGLVAPLGDGDAFTAAICAELALAGHTAEHHGSLWARALDRGHAVAAARSARR
ncbi:MAG TPA: PfkB family carbohydrate kinase [Labilithrix sp.]|nr:PfkB family carbohydrate kinase [Labilithrix sp.]